MIQFLSFFILITLISYLDAKDPHDDDLVDKNLICFNESLSVDDWGIKFLRDKKVQLFSLDKNIYEIYQYSRKYRTDLRNILIMKKNEIEYTINRSKLMLGNKQCKLVSGDPSILLNSRIKELKLERQEGNKI